MAPRGVDTHTIVNERKRETERELGSSPPENTWSIVKEKIVSHHAFLFAQWDDKKARKV